MLKTKYIIVQWPESQYFIGHPQCYLMQPMEHNELQYDSAYFVPENVYNEIISEELNVIWGLHK